MSTENNKRADRSKRSDGELNKLARKTRHYEKTLSEALDAAAQNNWPNVSEVDELGLTFVPDPLEQAGVDDTTGKLKPTELRARVVSLRNDPIGLMAKREQLGDAAAAAMRLKAARTYQAIYERTEIGRVRSIDPTATVVDGGRFVGPDVEGRGGARTKLAILDAALGDEGREIVRAVLISKLDIATLARQRGAVTKRDTLYYGRRFQECLDTIAKRLGFKQKVRGNIRHSDQHADLARAADISPDFHRAVHRARTGR